jgi:hypothetical protein
MEKFLLNTLSLESLIQLLNKQPPEQWSKREDEYYSKKKDTCRRS